MGQKVNPNGFRYGITKERNSQWIAKDKDVFVEKFLEDQKIYDFFKKFNRKYLIGQVQIFRNQKNESLVKVHSAKPGDILGKGGENLKALNIKLKKFLKDKNAKITIEVIEIEKPELNAFLVAQDLAIRLENRDSFRIIQKNAIKNAMKAGAIGIKTSISGRLNGADMARKEGYTEGQMKLHTLRQEVDYASYNANTKYGIIGVKVWISKGEKLSGGNVDVTTEKN